MKTITFYSYKGGVGRSLTMANMANRLAEFGKSVCLVDFDLEAPGLHLKFQNELTKPITSGLVDYIYRYANDGILPVNITDYCTRLRLYNNDNVHLLPAGNIENTDYWKRLSSIDWYNLVYENPDSISFFLDLKQKIKKELNPDFLLIDSRTGISEMSGITISLLADEVIVVSANNKENLMGSKRIIDFLTNPEKSILGTPLKVSFVLSRIPLPDNPKDKGREQFLIAKIKKELPEITPDNFFILHSDRDMELNEEMRIGFEWSEFANHENKSLQLTSEYLGLFDSITKGVLTFEEITKFEILKKSSKLYEEALNNPFPNKKIELLNKAIEFNPQNTNALISLGTVYLHSDTIEGSSNKGLIILENTILKYPNQTSGVYSILGYAYFINKLPNKALEIYNKMLELFPDEQYKAFFGMGYVMHNTGQYEKSVEYFTKALVENSEELPQTYNSRANSYRYIGNYKAALEDIYKALELDPEAAISYMTLSEIYAAQDKSNEFYINLEIALNKNSNEVLRMLPQEKIYSKFLTEQRFINLLEKYDIPIPTYE